MCLLILDKGKRGRERETSCERETLIGWLSHTPQTGGTPNLGICPDQEWMQDPLGYGATLQPTEQHCPGHAFILMY